MDQIWRHIEREEMEGRTVTDGDLPFRSKAVYYYWHIVTRQAWRFANDPFDSARQFLTQHGSNHHVSVLEVEQVPGMKALAFQVDDFMSAWAANTQELAMDSTCMFSV